MTLFRGLLLLRFLILIRTRGGRLLSIYSYVFYLIRSVGGLIYQVFLLGRVDRLL